MIKIKKLTKNYYVNGEKFTAVNNVDFTLQKNKIYSLVGESGSGKSTLARMISLIEKPSSGDILYKNKSIIGLTKKQILKKRKDIQLVLQDGKSALDPCKSVKQLIMEPLKNIINLTNANSYNYVTKLMNQVELPLTYLTKKPYQLSGGEQKRVNIARAIGVSPQLIIFDEALGSQDVIVRKRLLDLLKNIQQEAKCTFLFITHDLDVALYISERIVFMKNGIIVEDASVNDDNEFKHSYSKKLIAQQYCQSC